MEKLVEDIQAFFPEFKINVSDLKSPNCRFVTYFFIRVLSELGVDVDHVQRVQINQLDDEYPEEMDIIPQLNLVTSVRCAFPFLNFQLNDLLYPDYKRNTMLMREVMRFLDFCESRCAANNAKVEEYQEAKMRERELANLKEKQSSYLNKLAQELDSSQQTLRGLEDSISKLQLEIEQNREAINAIEVEYQEAMNIFKKTESAFQNLHKEMQAMVQEYDECRKLLVNNPEEEKKDFDLKARERDRVIENKKEYQEKFIALGAEIEKLQKQGETLKVKITPILNELHVIQEYSDLKKLDAKAQGSLESLKKKREELINELGERDKEIHSKNEKYSAKESDFEMKIKSLKETLQQKKNDYKSTNKEIKSTCKKYKEDLEKILNQKKNLENDYRTLLTSFNLVMEELNEKKKKLVLQ